LPMDNQLLQHDIFYCGLPACLSLQKICHTLCNCVAFRLCALSYADKVCFSVQKIRHTLCNLWRFTSVNCHMLVKMVALWKRFATHCATYGVSPVWTVICWLRWLLSAKDLPHTVQLFGFSPVWTLVCWSRAFFGEKDLPHTVQLNGFSPVWTLVCLSRANDL
jgi:hypothetical protein